MSLHLKRLAAPRAWAGTVPKKKDVWVVKPIPGPHALEESIPLGLILRDYLKVCDTTAEAKRIISDRLVLVDGRPAFSYKQGAGFMDVISLPRMDSHHRVLLDRRGRVFLSEIPVQNAAWKLSRIEGKTTVSGGRTQLNLHDGRNVLVKEQTYKTGDTLKLHVPEQKIMAHYPLAKGHTAIITGGAHIGELATFESLEVTRNPSPNIVHMRAGDRLFTTIKPYAFVVGKEKAEVQIPASEVM